tara:strand:- start:981 stop:1244 length:264 start_codon:yes stop_codon:yes gene_type:complete
MKSFIYKSIIVVIAVIVIFEFTIGNKISQIYDKIDVVTSKEGRKESIDKIREELKKAVSKERYLSKEDAKLIKKFISKIQLELNETD